MDSSLQSPLPRNQLVSLCETWEGYLEELAELITTGEASAVKQSVLAALVTLDVHARDVINTLAQDVNVGTAENNFTWVRSVTQMC